MDLRTLIKNRIFAKIILLSPFLIQNFLLPMPLNRATLIIISTIDKCLQNHYRRWTINDLIDACTDALAEYEGRSNPVSRRTFQNDLALMRSDRLGYNAPIVVRDNKYY